jgi:hypothetical protein
MDGKADGRPIFKRDKSEYLSGQIPDDGLRKKVDKMTVLHMDTTVRKASVK